MVEMMCGKQVEKAADGAEEIKAAALVKMQRIGQDTLGAADEMKARPTRARRASSRSPPPRPSLRPRSSPRRDRCPRRSRRDGKGHGPEDQRRREGGSRRKLQPAGRSRSGEGGRPISRPS